ncbi:MAG TPA: hypothetical protein VNN23_01495 [Ornithinibacter sp.]|nr:hypothetical protein [Ornithinibacter sp.]
MGRVVIACFVPKAGRERDLHELSRSHVPRLRAEGLASEREPIIAVAADGTVIEVFEWVSAEAIATAHQSATVRAMWTSTKRSARTCLSRNCPKRPASSPSSTPCRRSRARGASMARHNAAC